MDELEVGQPNLAGFNLDLQDLSTSFTSNAARLLPGVALPSQSAELMSTLAPAFKTFHTAMAAAYKSDLGTVDRLGTHLVTAKREYKGAENVSTNGIVSAVGIGAGQPADEGGPTRFSGLNLPYLQEVEDAPATVRNVVTAGIQLIGPYDEPLGQKIGLRPAKEYLEPLVGDWEALQTVGERIGLLGVNDYTASENIAGGTNWLQTSWKRLGSQTFGDNAAPLGESIAGRSWDMDGVSKIVQNAGACLERMVYNQAIELSSALTKPMTFVGFTLPLGVWALLIDKPMQESNRSQIVAAVDALKDSVKTRHNNMTAMLGRVSSALEYSPDRAAPKFAMADFEVPERVDAGSHLMQYGFGGHVWWQHKAVSEAPTLSV
ncbi:hypothetical protein [Nocardia sp. XZ_19_385]|uniref:hypothetical protein n=1 Tax=Nocardia sp. XZ_19_385 TaxID=2769488 RepID=UPI00188ECF0C|nr:hypothetical protein [Nocardia sp. XZ_19_385]